MYTDIGRSGEPVAIASLENADRKAKEKKLLQQKIPGILHKGTLVT